MNSLRYTNVLLTVTAFFLGLMVVKNIDFKTVAVHAQNNQLMSSWSAARNCSS
jgi:hypothetical protein